MTPIWDRANPQLRRIEIYEPGKPLVETAPEIGAEPDEIIRLCFQRKRARSVPKRRCCDSSGDWIFEDPRAGKPARRLRNRAPGADRGSSKTRQPFNVNGIGQIAALAALGDLERLEKSKRLVQVGRGYIEQQFQETNLKFVPSAGNFVFVNVGDGLAVFKRLLARKIIVRPLLG